MIGTTIDGLGLTESQAGFLGTVEFLSMMCASVIISPFMGRVPRRKVAFLALFIAVVGNGLCVFTDPLSYNTLMTFRMISGFGCGLALAVGNATLSNAANPEKMAGQMNVLFGLAASIVLLAFGWSAQAWGYKGIYGGLAVFMLLMAPFLAMLPEGAATPEKTQEATGLDKSMLSLTTVLVFSAIFLFALRDMAGWAFVERVGLNVGYSSGQVGNLLSLQAALGISGALLVAVMGSRFGLKVPLLIGIICSGLVYFVILVAPESKLIYTIAALFIAFTYLYTLAYLTAFAATLDSKGRVVAAAGGFISAGVAFGSYVGGYLIETYGYAVTSWAILGMTLLTFIFVSYAIKSMSQN
jgi:predicted MFS family arabinose efflux permease